MRIEYFRVQLLHELREDSLWCEVPGHPRSDWAEEASNHDTTLGYWAWVEERILGDIGEDLTKLQRATAPASGLRCPSCGDGRRIAVCTPIWGMHDEFGTDIHDGELKNLTGYDQDWRDDDDCRCPTCKHFGTVETFTPIMLDEKAPNTNQPSQ
mgnify:FL=1|tara:strand:- start:1672 stop:2133 length:462 start_codon:yes stop_codon:yes gene_type:complete